MKTRWLWYRIRSEIDRWGNPMPIARWQWQHYKTSGGWFQMMRFGFFGVNIYGEIPNWVPGSTIELRGVNLGDGVRMNTGPVTRIDLTEEVTMGNKFFDVNYELEVEGQKCTICSITARVACPPYQSEDTIGIDIQLNKAVGSTIGFFVLLPVKTYERKQLIDLITQKIQQSFAEFRREATVKAEQRGADEVRQAYLDKQAEAVASIFIDNGG